MAAAAALGLNGGKPAPFMVSGNADGGNGYRGTVPATKIECQCKVR